MRHSEYTDFFRQLASQHVDIRHSEEECHFVRLILSSDPLQRIMDAREFYDSLRDRIGPDFSMILISYEADYADNGGDQRIKEYHGSFIILHPVTPGHFDELEQVLDRTEEIGEEIMGAALVRINKDFTLPKKHMTVNGITNERIGPVGEDFHGTKFNFFFTRGANPALHYKQDKFIL
ncbi:hypothetical protein [Pontibacter beigongshangensis]|uniref:hypothetical protein n=1 Tax=Pontibacter beigongshangensis TaxID=2574733 RepID=UPI0016509977|nr:hypothetical protein [Pontibacter beigongshangensis]